MNQLLPFLFSPLGQVAWLTLGAVLVLLLAAPLSAQPNATRAIGVLFALGGIALSVAQPGGLNLAVPALCGVAALAILLLPALVVDLEDATHTVECTALLLLGTGGAIALATATDLVQVVVGLETLALSAVVMIALTRGEAPLEAAFKYFVLGALSLAALLYGVGLVYLGTGSFAFPTTAQLAASPLVLAGAVLVGLGIAFELAVFPFHWGGLDAYTAGAPPLAGYVMSASKLAAAFALGKLVVAAGVEVAQVLIWVGVLTIIWGTFGAMAQRGLRRMLGYSAVVHAGFIALAVGSGPQGPVTAQFYAVVYGIMAMLVFAAIAGRTALPGDDGSLPFGTVGGSLGPVGGGLGPVRSAALALGLLSLGGIPPTPGFWAKLAVLVVAWQAAGPLPTLVAVAGGVFSVLYYLRPLPDLFAALRAGGAPAFARLNAAPTIVLATILVIVTGLAPGLVWALTRTP